MIAAPNNEKRNCFKACEPNERCICRMQSSSLPAKRTLEDLIDNIPDDVQERVTREMLNMLPDEYEFIDFSNTTSLEDIEVNYEIVEPKEE